MCYGGVCKNRQNSMHTINKQGRIYYSNISKDVAEKCRKIFISLTLPADGAINYNVGYYTVTMIRLIWMRHTTIDSYSTAGNI